MIDKEVTDFAEEYNISICSKEAVDDGGHNYLYVEGKYPVSTNSEG